MEYVALDFETGNPSRFSMCEIGLVHVKDGIIVDEYTSLIRPPDNNIIPKFSGIHGIFPNQTGLLDEFPYFYYHEILKRLKGKFLVAHNESFDRSVLYKTMEYFEIQNNLDLLNPDKFDCTMKIYRQKKFISGALKFLCDDLKIPLNHHKALDDSRACAELYYKHIMNDYSAELKY